MSLHDNSDIASRIVARCMIEKLDAGNLSDVIKEALNLKDSQAQAKIAELRWIIKVKDEGLNWGKPRLDYRRIHDETFGSLDTHNPFDEALNHHEGKE